MKVGKKLFPYPTLNNSDLLNSYVESHYSVQFDMVQEENNLVLKNTHIDIENMSIERFLEDGRARAILIIECSQTIYRKIIEISLKSQDIKIPLSDLNGTVELSSYIYATKDIENYNSEYFLEDYRDYNFNIEKYDILAIDDGYRTSIIHEDKKDKKISSIFSVIPNINQEIKEGFEVSAEKDKIVISIPYEYYGSYDNMRFNDNFMNIFFGLMAIPALSSCLQTIKDNFEEYNDDLEEVVFKYSWFNSVINRYKVIFEKDMTSESFKEMDSFFFAQCLLDNGSTKAIGDLKKMLLEGCNDDIY